MSRPHDAMLDLAHPFIKAWKAGETEPIIETEELIYWYRIMPHAVNCDATDTTMVPANNGSGNYFMGRPNGYDSLADAVFVVAFLLSPGTVVVNSGGNEYIFNAPAGASSLQVPMGLGSQYFALQRNGATVMDATSLREIKDECPCGYDMTWELFVTLDR
jgi:Glycosyl hydrolase family 71